MSLPRTPVVGDVGDDILAHKRALAQGLGQPRWKNLLTKPPGVRRRWFKGNQTWAEQARRKFGLNPGRGLDPMLHARMLRAGWYDSFGLRLLADYAKAHRMPALGPVFAGGRSVLDHDLTHATSGIPLFPAFDDAFREGTEIIAPEPLTVSLRMTSSNPGRAFFADGASGLRYWFGHLDRDHPLGRRFAKGDLVGRVAPNSIGGGPHVHVGINVERLLGRGRQLQHRTDYRHGSPTVGAQLRKALG